MLSESDLMHGVDWSGQDLAGWYVSVKLDGCRAFWDGRALRSRSGLEIEIPDAWRAGLVGCQALDCEIYDRSGGLRSVVNAVTYGRFRPTTALAVFDLPDPTMGQAERIAALKDLPFANLPWAHVVAHWKVRSTDEALDQLRAVVACGGEGLVARHPDLIYRPGRSTGMLKLKEIRS